MKIYLFLSMSLTLVYQGFGRNIETPNTEATLNLVQNSGMPNIENVLNSTEKTENLTTASTIYSKGNTASPIKQNTSELTENIEMSTKSYFDWGDDDDDDYDAEVTEKIPEPNCPENMRPSFWNSETNIWKCICEPSFFITPLNNTCVKPFRQGPCEPGNFVIQPPIGPNKSTEPRCALNPCLEDGLVPYNGTCHNATTNSVCHYGRQYFNQTTSEIGCIYEQIHPRTVIEVPTRRNCPSDSRVDKNGRCRRKL